jgi:hypothetical protein
MARRRIPLSVAPPPPLSPEEQDDALDDAIEVMGEAWSAASRIRSILKERHQLREEIMRITKIANEKAKEFEALTQRVRALHAAGFSSSVIAMRHKVEAKQKHAEYHRRQADYWRREAMSLGHTGEDPRRVR